MPDYACDAAQMIRTIRERMGRDPARIKQFWRFSFTIESVITEERANSLAQLLSEQIQGQVKLWGPPEYEFEFDFDNGVPSKTRMACTFRSKMEETQLSILHEAFRRIADAKRMIYHGVEFFEFEDPRLDAHELFLQQEAFHDRDLETSPAVWKFGFDGVLEDPPTTAQTLVDQFVELTQKPVETIEASLQFLQGAEGDSHFVEISCPGCFTEADLSKLHKKLKRAGKKLRLRYLGVELGTTSESIGGDEHQPRRDFEDPAELFEGKTLSLSDGMSWTKEVITKTSKFEVKTLPKIASKIRNYHLKKLLEQGMQAADWMPTADQRVGKTIRPKSEIVQRLMGAYVSTAWVCAPQEFLPDAVIKAYLSDNELKKNAFSKKELAWMQTKRSDVGEYASNAGWVMENVWSLAWLLGYPFTPCISGEMVDDQVFDPLRSKLMKGFERTYDGLMAKTKLRRLETVIALEDLMYCAHNSVRTKNVVHGGLMHERRHPLTWALSPGVAWDDTDLST